MVIEKSLQRPISVDAHDKQFVQCVSPSTAIPNSERVYVVPADQHPSAELKRNGKSRVSASEIFEFGIAGPSMVVTPIRFG